MESFESESEFELQQPPNGDEPVEDYGRHIAGAVKDDKRSTLPPYSEGDTFSMSKHFPTAKPRKGENLERWNVYATYRALVGGKPRSRYGNKAEWLNRALRLRDNAFEAINTDSNTSSSPEPEFLVDYLLTHCLIENIGEPISTYRVRYLESAGTRATYYQLYKTGSELPIETVSFPTIDSSDYCDQHDTIVQEREVKALKTLTEAAKLDIAKPPKTSKFEAKVGRQKNVERYMLYKRKKGQTILLKDGFETVAAAFDYLRTNQDELRLTWAGLLNPAYRRAENRPRVGPIHDVTSHKDLTPLFGISGVTFGKSMGDAERDRSAKLCAEAYLDMATVLNIDPKLIGLNETLGMGFGTHGRGGANSFAAAYFSGNIKAVALTRKQGAGSLAHEWAHAMDDYLSDDDRLMTRGEHNPEMAALVEAINNSDIAERSKKADVAKSKAYFNTMTEMVARVFESCVHAELVALGQINDYLVSIHPDSKVHLLADEIPTFAPLVRALVVSAERKYNTQK